MQAGLWITIALPMTTRRWEGRRAEVAGPGAGCRVLLYERNGLQHGGFTTRGSARVSALEWSPDSTLLCVVTRGGEEAGASAVQVWLRRNWHWYLKWERRVGGAGDVFARWDDELPGRLVVVSDAGAVTSVRFAEATDVSGERGWGRDVYHGLRFDVAMGSKVEF